MLISRYRVVRSASSLPRERRKLDEQRGIIIERMRPRQARLPVARHDRAGRVRFIGHFGGIYRDSSAIYLGRTKPRRIWLTPTGTGVSERALCKLRNDERGAAYAYNLLRQYGASDRDAGDDGGAYITRALVEGPFCALHHGGNHIYAFALGTRTERKHMSQILARDLTPPCNTDPVEQVTQRSM